MEFARELPRSSFMAESVLAMFMVTMAFSLSSCVAWGAFFRLVNQRLNAAMQRTKRLMTVGEITAIFLLLAQLAVLTGYGLWLASSPYAYRVGWLLVASAVVIALPVALPTLKRLRLEP
jgi:phosphatidylglycerophosphate synthase